MYFKKLLTPVSQLTLTIFTLLSAKYAFLQSLAHIYSHICEQFIYLTC